MESRINGLEEDVRRLRAELQALKLDSEWRRHKTLNRAYLATYLVTSAVLLGAFWRGFGWI